MNDQINYRYAEKEDFEAIVNLLKENDLPVVDLDLIKIKFILAETEDKMVGCIGIEPYGTEGLLRSLAVDINFRNLGIANSLLQYLISYSKQLGIINLHLLTSTAESYFLSKNFVQANRQAAPDSIKNTIEFSTLCPSSSSYMAFYNISQNGLKYSENLYLKMLDSETQSKYWAISGTNQMLTYFEVESDKIFAKHSHESEQITYVLEGELFFEINNSIYRLIKGDSIIVPSNIPHKVWTKNKKARAIDAWSPINGHLL